MFKTLVGCFNMYRIILLTYMGIVISQYNDTYEPWNGIRVLNVAHTVPKFNIDTQNTGLEDVSPFN